MFILSKQEEVIRGCAAPAFLARVSPPAQPRSFSPPAQTADPFSPTPPTTPPETMDSSRTHRTSAPTIRLTPGELAILQGRARSAGVPPSTYLRDRALAHRIRSRGSRFSRADVDRLAELGTELNRLAHAANTTRRIVGEEELARLLAEIRSAFRELRPRLAQ